MREDDIDQVDMSIGGTAAVSHEDAHEMLTSGIFSSRALSGAGTELGIQTVGRHPIVR